MKCAWETLKREAKLVCFALPHFAVIIRRSGPHLPRIWFFAYSIHYRARHAVLCAYLTPDIIVQDANHEVGVSWPSRHVAG